jgi:transcriptional regulator with XRE-family HTH domain
MKIIKSMHSKEYQKIAQKIKNARLDAGLKQEEAAHKLRKPQSYISKIEAGERRLDVLELKQLIRIYNKPADYFIN